MTAYPPLWSPEVEARIRAEARNLDPQKVPEHVQMCVRCVVTNQRPRITFDASGVCSACRYWERKRNGIDWVARERELVALLDRHRRTSGYDVIVPASGGKDSSMVAHKLATEFGMHVLATKWAPFIYTDIGRRNWEAFGQHIDCIEARPAGLQHRKLARLALEYLGDPFEPFVFGQLAFPMRLAYDMGIGLVFGGENGDLEYTGHGDPNKSSWDIEDWDRVYLKGAGVTRLLDIGREVGAFTDDEARGLSDFYYIPDAPGVEYHHWGFYRNWSPTENFFYASDNTGFQPDDGRSEGTYTRAASLDDRLDAHHYFFGWLKYGIGRCTSDAAQEVRDGRRTRDEALALVGRYDGEVPQRHHAEVMDYLGLDQEQYGQIVRRFAEAPIGSAPRYQKPGPHQNA